MTSFGGQPGCSALSVAAVVLPPGGEVGVHEGDEGGELGVLVDRAFDVRLFYGHVEVAGAVRFEERLSKLWADGPVARQDIDIGGGDAAFQWPATSCPSSGVWLSM